MIVSVTEPITLDVERCLTEKARVIPTVTCFPEAGRGGSFGCGIWDRGLPDGRVTVMLTVTRLPNGG